MPLLLHAITPKLEDALTVGGLRGRPLTRVHEQDFTAWVSALSNDTESFTREDLWNHHRVVSEVFVLVEACLPARFPTWVADKAALRGLLATHRSLLTAQFRRVRGCCELAVTAVWTTAEDAPPRVKAATPGRQYLLERQVALEGSERRHARARELAQELEALAGDDLIEAQRRVCPSPTIALSSALLVKRASAEDLKRRLSRARRDVRILIHGPWPPYSFTAIGSQ